MITQTRDELTDSMRVHADLSAQESIATRDGSLRPKLELRCAVIGRVRRLDAAVLTGGPSAHDELTLRIGSGAPFDVPTTHTDNMRWQGLPDSAESLPPGLLVRHISHGDQLRVAFAPYLGTRQVFNFRLAGIDSVLRIMRSAGCQI